MKLPLQRGHALSADLTDRSPELSVGFALSLVIPFAIGLIIVLALKQLAKLAVALIALVALLMAFGYVSPQGLPSLLALFQA